MHDIRTILFCCVAVIALITAATGVRADDRQDCARNLTERKLIGCTRLIESAGLAPAEKAWAFANRGRGYLARVGHERLAAADFDQARKLVSAQSSEAALYEGLAFLARRQTDQAIVTASEALKRDPKSALAYVARAAARRAKGEIDAAVQDCDAATRLDPSLATAYVCRGNIFGTRKEHERAVAEFDAAIRIDPTYVAALRTRALAKSELGRLDEALADYNAVIALDPHFAPAYNGRGHVHSKKGDKERAFADYDQAVRLDPTMMVALGNRALSYANRREFPAAIADLERMLALPALSVEDRNRQQVARERMARLKAQAAEAARNPGLAPASAHRRVALVIGNSKYVHAPALPNPVNDAKSVATSLRRLGFTVVTEIQNATRDQMAKALQDHGDASEQAEWSVVFFAGHGIEIGGMSYLIPVDAALRRDAHVEDEAIGLSRVLAKVDAASRIGLVMLDSCRDNPFVPKIARSVGGNTRSVRSGLAPIEPDGNVLVAYAARHGTVAEDGKGTNSPFTEAILAHIEEPGLEVSLLFRKVRDTVRQKTERRQDPFTYGTLGSEQLFLKSASAR